MRHLPGDHGACGLTNLLSGCIFLSDPACKIREIIRNFREELKSEKIFIALLYRGGGDAPGGKLHF